MSRLDDIAKRISEHLKRFESDPAINARRAPNRIVPYFLAGARRAGRYIAVKYVNFQYEAKLLPAEAEAYLKWLDAGNVGRHTAMQRESISEQHKENWNG